MNGGQNHRQRPLRIQRTFRWRAIIGVRAGFGYLRDWRRKYSIFEHQACGLLSRPRHGGRDGSRDGRACPQPGRDPSRANRRGRKSRPRTDPPRCPLQQSGHRSAGRGAELSRGSRRLVKPVEDAKTGARLGVPEKITPHVEKPRSGTCWSLTQGQIQIETFRLSDGAAAGAVRTRRGRRRTGKSRFSNLKPDSFVILGVQGLKYFWVRDTRRHRALRSGDRRHHEPRRHQCRQCIRRFSRSQCHAAAGLAAAGRIWLGHRGRRRRRSDRVGAQCRRLPGGHRAAVRPCRAHRRGQGEQSGAYSPLRRAQLCRGAAADTLASKTARKASTSRRLASPIRSRRLAMLRRRACWPCVTAQGIEPAPKLGFPSRCP